MNCGYLKGPFYPSQGVSIKLGQCYSCSHQGPYKIANTRTVYRNFQKITIQESPSLVQAGRIPRNKEAILMGDNVDTVKAGD